MGILLVFIVGIIVIYLGFIVIKFNGSDAKDNIRKAKQFNDEFIEAKKIYLRYSCKNDLIKKYRNTYNFLSRWPYKELSKRNEEVEHFLMYYGNFDEEVKLANEEYVRKTLEEEKKFFDNIDGKSLDEQQRRAVLTNEDNNLVVAGAGSGKTLTIAAKVKFLVEKMNVKPSEILLISFTKKAAQEMQDRIYKNMNIEIQAKTFHKLGIDIISNYRHERPDVAENTLEKVVNDYFFKDIYQNQSQLKNLVVYFGTYMNLPPNMDEIKNLGEMIKLYQRIELGTLKGTREKYLKKKELDGKILKLEKERDSKAEKLNKIIEEIEFCNNTNTIKGDTLNNKKIVSLQKQKKVVKDAIQEIEMDLAIMKKTLKGEVVKSLEEVMIANYLFLNGIKYEYEIEYPIKYTDVDRYRKKYRPDFYLPEYNIYIEHFGVNENMEVPWLSEIEARKYLDGIGWKRGVHEENNTTLIETYSYYNKEGVLLIKLHEELKKNGVVYKDINYNEIYNIIVKNYEDKYFGEFKKLIQTFIGLFKSRNFSESYFKSIDSQIRDISNSFERDRSILFMKIVKPIFKLYQKKLEENKEIDFNDMINEATNVVKTQVDSFNYKYIIIDEYQDISESRFKLIKEIREKCGASIMCVGDDWQSIYRFSGSDINLFLKFEELFGKTEVLKIEKTYRNSQELIDICGKFVMKNDKQIKKKLISPKRLETPIEIVKYTDNDNEFIQCLIGTIDKIINEFGEEARITIIGRNNNNVCKLVPGMTLKELDSGKCESEDFIIVKNKEGEVIITLNSHPKANIKFITAHKSKGLEDDNVIVINLTNDKYGFPNQIADDPVLRFVMIEPDDYDFAEERRVFYVALTRTKNKVYLITPIMNQSLFCEELNRDFKLKQVETESAEQVLKQPICPRCNTGYLVNRKQFGEIREFVGCSNYPLCDLTFNDVKVIEDKVICPSCGGYMIRRKGPYGEFYGCTNYPICSQTLAIDNAKKYKARA